MGLFNKRSFWWTAVGLFLVVVGLQATSYIRLSFTLHDNSNASPDSIEAIRDDPPLRYTRDYTTLYVYAISLALVYCSIMVYAWLCRRGWARQKTLDKPIKPGHARLRRWLQYEMNILGCSFSLTRLLSILALVFLNIIHFFLRDRVLDYEAHNTGIVRDLYFQEYANRSAQLAVVNFSAAVFLSVRHAPILAGFGFDMTVAWHAYLGQLGALFALYHACFQFLRNYPRQDYDALRTLTSSVHYTTGFMMVVSALVLVLGAHPLVRSLSYRFFRISHLAAFLVLAAVGALHHWAFIVFYAGVGGVWLVDQWLYMRHAKAVAPLALDILPSKIVRLQVQPLHTALFATVTPGQFVFLSWSSSAFASRLNPHPFSISRVDYVKNKTVSTDELAAHDPEEASHPGTAGHARLTFYIRASGRETAFLHNRAAMLARNMDEKIQGPMLRLSPPMGRPCVDIAGRTYGDFDVVVLVAEGIGITPWIAVLQDLVQRQHETRTKRFFCLWSIRKKDILHAFRDEFKQAAALSRDMRLHIQVFLTRQEQQGPEAGQLLDGIFQVRKGRPDYHKLLARIRSQCADGRHVLGVCAHRDTTRVCGNIVRSSAFSNQRAYWAFRSEQFEF
ncbi:hypothetical protein BCR43DRAFT_483786 [Syncephalastrum racemosum]|uniref:FAD-binding FR-type domain-containing protein n=1 Tax=Syncephalastrum racemosum TaxID=13706 RepID=A0A1X2HVU0_SYNRA|nr:hypothetical protein BCR43DRAFT_483786 [Syncephalastrum racemosum]